MKSEEMFKIVDENGNAVSTMRFRTYNCAREFIPRFRLNKRDKLKVVKDE